MIMFVPRLVRRLLAVSMAPGSAWIGAVDLVGRLRDRDDVVIIDVRDPDEFIGPLGHIAGALNLPAGGLSDRLSELDQLRSRALTLVCKTDRRSAKAAELLRGAGFENVSVLRGGMEQWTEGGLPVESAMEVNNPSLPEGR